jgi:CHAT domain-containing protein
LSSALKKVEQGLQRTVPSEEWHFKFAVLKGEVLMWKGQPTNALSALPASLPTALATTEFALRSLLVQAHVLASLGRIPESFRTLAQAEALAKQSVPRMVGDTALEKGTLAFRQGHDSEAMDFFRSALMQARQSKRPFLEAEALGSIGLQYSKMQRYDEAITWSSDALKLSRSNGFKLLEPGILINLGWSKLEFGDWESAKPDFIDAAALAASRDLLAYEGDALVNLGRISFERSSFHEAEEYYQKALETYRSLSYGAKAATCLLDLAQTTFETGHPQEAERYLEQSKILLSKDDQFQRIEIELLQARMLAQANPDLATRALNKIILTSSYKSQKWEAEAVLASTYVATGQAKQAEVQFARLLNTLDAARATLKREEYKLAFSSREAQFYKDYVEFLMSQEKAQEAFLVADRIRARTLTDALASGNKQAPRSLSISRLQSLLQKRKQTLIAYWLAPKRSFLWLVNSHHFQRFELPSQATLEAKIKNYADALPNGKGIGDAAAKDGQELYNWLVRPAQFLIAHDEEVVVVPDGSLARLNFETLVVPGAPPHYWIDDVTVQNASSVALLANIKRRQSAGRSILAIGDAVDESGAHTLANARKEIDEVARFAPANSELVITGKSATPSSYAGSHPEQFQRIHFAAHGVSNQINPLESAILLSPDGEKMNKLYGRDIIKLKLNARLVIISSCRGAQGRIYGEGSVALAWAFMRAGASNVVAALWNLDDAAAADLMKTFYVEMAKGKSEGAALREAKRALKRDPDHQRPYYWASLQLYTAL